MYISLSQALFMGGVLSFTIFSIPTLADDTFDHAQDIEETHSIITLNDAVAKAISASPRIKGVICGRVQQTAILVNFTIHRNL